MRAKSIRTHFTTLFYKETSFFLESKQYVVIVVLTSIYSPLSFCTDSLCTVFFSPKLADDLCLSLFSFCETLARFSPANPLPSSYVQSRDPLHKGGERGGEPGSERGGDSSRGMGLCMIYESCENISKLGVIVLQ